MEAARAAKEEEELLAVTAKPAINKASKVLQRSVQDLYEWGRLRKEKAAARRRQEEKVKVENLTVRASISKGSQRILAEKENRKSLAAATTESSISKSHPEDGPANTKSTQEQAQSPVGTTSSGGSISPVRRRVVAAAASLASVLSFFAKGTAVPVHVFKKALVGHGSQRGVLTATEASRVIAMFCEKSAGHGDEVDLSRFAGWLGVPCSWFGIETLSSEVSFSDLRVIY